MIEICPKTFCFIPIKTKAIIFGAVISRGELAARLLRAFYTEEELRDAKSLGNLRNGAVIISAIIACSTRYNKENLPEMKTIKIRKALHNAVAYANRDKKEMVKKQKVKKFLTQSS
ncbi:uncharacterized protein [Mytilus edulis]|uniref:uncharacterized protein n=1 Tax=Mytilus edulis TaxID=6550 RepID=UPI0039EED84B